MGYKMNGPSLYKPKMADMDIQKDYAKKSDDRAMSSPYQKADGSYDKVEVKNNKKKAAYEEKKNAAIRAGKIANWNKKNPKATQDEMNTFITSLNKK